MNATYTLNSKVFTKSGLLGDSGVVLTTRDRGISLPDTLSVQHKLTKNVAEPGTFDARSVLSFTRTFDSGNGVMKKIEWKLQSVIPDDADATNVAAALDDLMDFLTSAHTLTAANVAVLTNREIA